MNINQVTEKAISELVGNLMVDNTKLKAMVNALSLQVKGLQKKLAEHEKPAEAEAKAETEEGDGENEVAAMAG